ncbi:MAG: DUF6089 family protein [Saprospiraceae bacterium]
MEVVKKNIGILVFLIAISTQFAYSQKGMEAGLWLGGAHYFGDLNNLYRINEPGLAGGATVRYNFNHRLSVRGQLNLARIRAHDTKSTNAFDLRRNLNFYSNIIEFAPAMEINFFHYKHGSKEKGVSPYLYGGYSFFYFNPKTKYNGETIELRPLGTEGQQVGQEYYSIAGAWLVGGGVKFDLNYRWSINVDLGYRFTSTDYLDDVHSIYPDYSELRSSRGDMAVLLADRSLPDSNNSKIGIEGTQRGDSRDKDAYITAGVNLIYFFGRLNCPPLSIPRE